MENVTKVNGSIEFRDAVHRLSKEGHRVYGRKVGFGLHVYAINTREGEHPQITTHDLFEERFSPIYMEDFAQALARAAEEGHPVEIEVFTL